MIGSPVEPNSAIARLSRPSKTARPPARVVRVATYTAPPRTTTISTTNSTRAAGSCATAAGSIAIPEVMKKTGISSPKARPVSLTSRPS